MSSAKLFKLPPAVAALNAARKALGEHYATLIKRQNGTARLSFNFDGNLVGDLGEACAAELFDLELVDTASNKGIDAYTPDGKSVQIKATGTKRGPAFTWSEAHCDFLIFLELNFESSIGMIIYNGPESVVRAYLPTAKWERQRSLSSRQIRDADARVEMSSRLPLRSSSTAICLDMTTGALTPG